MLTTILYESPYDLEQQAIMHKAKKQHTSLQNYNLNYNSKCYYIQMSKKYS